MDSKFILGDCFEVLSQLDDKTFDAVITDPPYGIGLADWDVVIDIEKFTQEVSRLTKEFYVFFGQMPTVLNWLNEASKLLKYKEHISWVKRISTQQNGLRRNHESIFIYKHNGSKFYTTTGLYSDVQVPGLMFDIVSIEGIQRYISDLHGKIKGTTNGIIEHGNRCQDVYRKRFEISQGHSRSPEFCRFTNVWSFLPTTHSERYNKNQFQHPTQKPLELIKRLIELTTDEGALILDPFAGSGTLAIACLETNRRYLCIEKQPEYYDIAMRRIEQWHNTPRQQELDLS